MQLLLATANDSKIKEIRQILNNRITFKTHRDFDDWPEVVETGRTFYDNALMKARVLADKYSVAAIADDSGLVVEAIGGEPGVRSARYAGVNAADEQNNDKLLELMQGKDDRSAAFVTSVVFYEPEGALITTEGRVEGRIIDRPVGKNGFGYDPVFIPEGHKKTFAQMSAEEKNALSHRGRAFRKLKKVFEEKGFI